MVEQLKCVTEDSHMWRVINFGHSKHLVTFSPTSLPCSGHVDQFSERSSVQSLMW